MSGLSRPLTDYMQLRKNQKGTERWKSKKAKCSTPDFAEENAAKLLKLFPECEGGEGTVDLDKLRGVLSSKVIEGNPYGLTHGILVMHGRAVVADAPRSFAGLRDYLRDHVIEGFVFWRDGEPRCKIKRSDFGFRWPAEGVEKSFLK